MWPTLRGHQPGEMLDSNIQNPKNENHLFESPKNISNITVVRGGVVKTIFVWWRLFFAGFTEHFALSTVSSWVKVCFFLVEVDHRSCLFKAGVKVDFLHI